MREARRDYYVWILIGAYTLRFSDDFPVKLEFDGSHDRRRLIRVEIMQRAKVKLVEIINFNLG